MRSKGRIRIILHSDTCFSAPESANPTVDIGVAFGADGLPRVSGKTIKGLLRDTWLSSRDYIDPDGAGAGLFGTPRELANHANLRIADATLGEAIADWAAWAARLPGSKISASVLHNAFLIRRTVTAENRATGAPLTDTLRTLAVLPAGAEFYAGIEAVDLTREQESLLELLCSLTRHAGLRRNRGLGHIEMVVEWDDSVPTEPERSARSSVGADVRFIPLRLHTNAPCLITGAELDDNSRGTLPWITGSAIRGAVAAALAHAGLNDSDIAEIVAGGSIRFLNAYPADSDTRGVPPAVTWRRDKNPVLADKDAKPADDSLIISAMAENRSQGIQRHSLSYPFYAQRDSTLTELTPALQATTHQARDRRTGVTGRSGGETVFVYEAIRPGATFLGCIAVEPGSRRLVGVIARALRQSPMWLGRSARSGYGGAPDVSLDDVSGFDDSTELGAPAVSLRAENYFIVRLTSHAALRDQATGMHDPWLLGSEIAERFAGVATYVDAYVQTTALTGFNALWRTDIGSRPAARAGSAVLLRASRDISAKQIAALQSRPIGERTVEGCGCFVVDDQAGQILSISSARDDAPSRKPPGAAPALLINGQRRLYEQRLRSGLIVSARTAAGRLSGCPSASLIQRLRVTLRSEDAWQQILSDWLGADPDKMLKETALRQLEKARIDRESLRSFLNRTSHPDWVPRFADALQADKDFAAYRIVDEDAARAIWNAALKSLRRFYLDCFLSALAKRARENAE